MALVLVGGDGAAHRPGAVDYPGASVLGWHADGPNLSFGGKPIDASPRVTSLSGPARRGAQAPLVFPAVNRFCMALLYGRAGRFTAQNGGFRPLMPPPVWFTIYRDKRLPG